MFRIPVFLELQYVPLTIRNQTRPGIYPAHAREKGLKSCYCYWSFAPKPLWFHSNSSLPAGPWMGRSILKAVKKWIVVYQFQTTYWNGHNFSKQLQNALRLFPISVFLYTENLCYFPLAQALTYTKHLWNHQNMHTWCFAFLFVLYWCSAFLLSLCLTNSDKYFAGGSG